MPSQMPFDVHSQAINVFAPPSSSFVERDVTSGSGKRPSTMEFITKCESKTLIESLIAGPAGM